jgi:Xaa-Pro dipeptidase
VFIGQPTDMVLAANETSKSALAAAKDAVRPGAPAREVFEAGSSVINNSGLPYKQGRRIAYGIGVAFPPGWDEGDILSINSEETMPLQAGMTFHLITTMRLPGIGAFGCSDTVLVTETGAETLTREVPPDLTFR